MSDAGVVIVGAGHAGVRAALAVRTAGYQGALTMIAAEGVQNPYTRPSLSKWTPSGTMAEPLLDGEQAACPGWDRVDATVTSIERVRQQVLLDDGRRLAYTHLLLATGAGARPFHVPGSDTVPVHTLRDRADAQRLRTAASGARRAIIVGGGFIGLELAASLRALDIDVQVIEMGERLLARGISAEVANTVHRVHTERGVAFTFGARITSVARRSGGIELHSHARAAIEADLLIAGIGSVPDTALAVGAGLDVDNGIVVDPTLQTSDPLIFAAGDCCTAPHGGSGAHRVRLESWQAAGEQGELAGRNLLVARAEREHCGLVPWFWSEQYDYLIQAAGLPGTGQWVERSYAADHHLSFQVSEQGVLRFACGVSPGVKIGKDIRLSQKAIGSGKVVNTGVLADPDVPLKRVLHDR